MINTAKGRPPAPVLAATLAMVIRAVAAAIPTPGNPDVLAQVLASVLVGGLMLVLAYGLIRGNSLARWLVVVLAAVNVYNGATHAGLSVFDRTLLIGAPLAVVGLLLLPRSSRRWFLDPPETATSQPTSTALVAGTPENPFDPSPHHGPSIGQ
ncbi:hypothetical protein [Micromonospora sp. DT47]|uniref:hypothetical protein n=1 Tax=Micromonospora sp. DT47 TaxID=3393431 RepID=UPI003CF0A280